MPFTMSFPPTPAGRCWLHLLAALVLFASGLAPAQVAVPVGAGSYAASIPPSDQFLGGYYSLTAQQVVNQFPNLHLAPALANRPVPSNQWWTDLLVADRSYQPSGGGPRVLQQDPFGGQLWSYPLMLAPNASGFNLYFPNAWNARSNPNLPVGSFNPGPNLPITGAVPLAVGSNDVLLADFNATNYPAGWVLTGTAFGSGPIIGGTWPGESPAVQGFLGSACVNTYRGANTPQGTLTSPAFTLQKNFIHLLVGGGADTNHDAVWLVIGTNVVKAAAGQQSGTLSWNTWDVSAYLGQTAQIEIVDTTSASWGFVLCSWIVASNDGSSPAARYSGSFAPVNSQVTGWSDWGVQFGLPDAQGRRMDLTLARGVPFVWTTYTGVSPVINVGSSTLYSSNGSVIPLISGSNFIATAFSFDYQGRTFGVFAPDNTPFAVAGTTLTAQLSGTNNYLVYGVLPADSYLGEFAGYAYARVTGTRFDWAYDRTNGQVDTTWTLSTTPLRGTGTNTLQGWLPHHYRTTTNDLSFRPYTYLTPRGLLRLAAGTQFHLNFPFNGIAPLLPAPHVNGLTNDYVLSRMTNYIAAFAASHPQHIADTYYGGKDLAITAQYMNFAQQLGLTNLAAQLGSSLRGELTNWFTYAPGKTNFFFARYANWGALIGFPADFGSEAFNDNHFHYGYFALAAGLLGLADTNFLVQYGPMARLVTKEYGNWDRTDTNFPLFRTFDLWEGHSWAGGFSSGGGENQESSSEALNSWVGLFLLGSALGDDAMTAAGAMGYATESAAVNEYWQDMYRTNLPASYGEGMVGILGSGGVSYATYFNGDPAWIHAIQWVPENHWNHYLARNKSFANWQLTNLWSERVVASQNGINGYTLTDANNATAQGGYLGNYILGFQLLFDPDGVAAQLEAGYRTNAAIATDATYSGVSYYLTHALRGLGDPDPTYHTSLPTSQVYYNPRTGGRTIIACNPAVTNQTAIIYHSGVSVGRLTVPPGRTSWLVLGETNQLPVTVQTGAQISWPTTLGTTWTLQTANAPGTNVTWQTLLGPAPGDGSTNRFFDLQWSAPHRQYRVLVATSGQSNIVVNPGFETGSGATASNWSALGSQPPVRVANAAHSGTYSLQLAVTNAASVPNTSEVDQNIGSSGDVPVVPGQTYNLSFWARQVSSGVSYVQNYRLSWLNNSGATLSSVGWNGFSAASGTWTQIVVNNLIAPTGAVNALVQIYGTTGAVLNGYGSVVIDDVALAYATASQTSTVPAEIQPGLQLSWPGAGGRYYDVQWAPRLGTTIWTNLVTAIPGTGTTNTTWDLIGTNQTRFYRVAVEP